MSHPVPMITGHTLLIAHLGYPTATFMAPIIYNPWFASRGIDAVVVPMGVLPEDFAVSLRQVMRLGNLRGALITMPYKQTTLGLVDEISATARIAGGCNAVLKRPDGSLLGDMFDGEGFVRGLQRKGREVAGTRVLISGAGGVGSAIAASVAHSGAMEVALFDPRQDAVEALSARLRSHYPQLVVTTGSNDPAGFDIIVNASPLGMHDSDPLPFDVARIAPGAFVGEVVLKPEPTPLLRAARDKGCAVQIGSDMLFEQIPAYLELFGFGTTTVDELRAIATLR